jgi:hypothetical protein
LLDVEAASMSATPYRPGILTLGSVDSERLWMGGGKLVDLIPSDRLYPWVT